MLFFLVVLVSFLIVFILRFFNIIFGIGFVFVKRGFLFVVWLRGFGLGLRFFCSFLFLVSGNFGLRLGGGLGGGGFSCGFIISFVFKGILILLLWRCGLFMLFLLRNMLNFESLVIFIRLELEFCVMVRYLIKCE